MAQRVARLPVDRWPADIDIWHLSMPLGGVPDYLHLDDAERARVLRYHYDADRQRFSVTRSVLRELLGEYVGEQPALLRFTSSERGKPELLGYEQISFNVSHSDTHALIAISRCRTVGVDIEHNDAKLDWRSLVRLVCTDDEIRILEAEPLRLQRQAFFRCWTAKEAILKALGLGITEGLRALTVNPTVEDAQQPVVSADTRFLSAKALQYLWLRDIPGYMACVAYDGKRLLQTSAACKSHLLSR